MGRIVDRVVAHDDHRFSTRQRCIQNLSEPPELFLGNPCIPWGFLGSLAGVLPALRGWASPETSRAFMVVSSVEGALVTEVWVEEPERGLLGGGGGTEISLVEVRLALVGVWVGSSSPWWPSNLKWLFWKKLGLKIIELR